MARSRTLAMTKTMETRVNNLVELKKQLSSWQWRPTRYGFWIHPFATIYAKLRIVFTSISVYVEKKQGPKCWIRMYESSFSKLNSAEFLEGIQNSVLGTEQNATPIVGPIETTK